MSIISVVGLGPINGIEPVGLGKLAACYLDVFSKEDIRRAEEYVDRQLRLIDLFAGVGDYEAELVPIHTDNYCSNRIGLWRTEEEDIISKVMMCNSSMRSIFETFDSSFLFKLNRIIRENAICGDCDPSERKHILREYYLEKERLEKRREELRKLRKLKTERVSNMIRAAWLNRNTAVGRSSTSSVTDTMLLSIPTPPTFKAANRSLVVGGAVIAFR